MVLCLAGVTDAVDLLTQHLFPSPSFLAPTLDCGSRKTLLGLPIHFPSHPWIKQSVGVGFAVLMMGVQGSHGTASGKVVFHPNK